ncbi:MAG: ATP-binding protein [Sulfuricurvum sp.]|jgi:signal transduction histidine kinase|nr:HAMP domain-containing sensor histidine kinase [Sulfuricurvum sp.]
MYTTQSPITRQYETDINRLQQDLEQINKSLFDATAHTAILLVNPKGELLQTNNYFHQVFDSVMDSLYPQKIQTLPITNTYGSCPTDAWFEFLTFKDERMLPKVEMTIEGKLLYFTIISTVINHTEGSSDKHRESYILSLTDITNVVELHKNEISISKELAYKQGIFDVTSEYIHNIGNIVTGAQHLSERIIKNLEPMQFFFKYFDHIKEQLLGNRCFIREEATEEYLKNLKKVEMSLNIIESSLTDTIKNVLDTDMKSLQKSISNIATTIAFQQELYKNTKTNMDEVVKLSELIGEIRSVIEPQLFRHDILLMLDVPSELTFNINRIHLFNGLLNLLKNSIHAVNTAYNDKYILSKMIKISARSVPREGSFFELDMMMNDSIVMAEDIVIDVYDNGIGMDETTIKNVFLQGFTTKHDGHGLGLHSFANFLTGNGHTITCKSEGIGKGSLFTITLTPEG